MVINIDQELLDKAINESVIKLFSVDNYNNPLHKLIEKSVGSTYNKGTLTEEIEQRIVTKLREFMETRAFDELLGRAVAENIAKREVGKVK